MGITEVRVVLTRNSGRILAYASVIFDGVFAVRDVKVIEHEQGYVYVTMPSRRATGRCRDCGSTNHLRAKFCNECGIELPEMIADLDRWGKPKFYYDQAHPITREFRDKLDHAVLHEFERMAAAPMKELEGVSDR